MNMKKLFGLLLLCAATVFSFVSCSKDGEKENLGLLQKELTLSAGQSTQLIYDGECVWKSDQPLIAEVDNKGLVTGKRVGTTLIHAGNEVCIVTVTPVYHTYTEPITDWGISVSKVKNLMAGYDLLSSSADKLIYEGSGIIYAYYYIFQNNKLYGSIAISDILLHAEEIADFLLERYVVIDVDREEYMAIMISIDAKTMVGLKFEASSNAVFVIYIPFQENYKLEILTNTKSLTKSIKNTEQETQINIDDLFLKLSKNQ